VPVMIKTEVTILRLPLPCPTLSIKFIKLSLWTFQVQGLNITETVISLYPSIAMIYERLCWKVIWDTQC